jgi:hypothetical protein
MLECDEKLMLYLASLPARMLDIPASSEDAPETPAQKRKKAKNQRDNEPRMEVKSART